MPHMVEHNSLSSGLGTRMEGSVSGRLMPFGRPVVPEEYSMS